MFTLLVGQMNNSETLVMGRGRGYIAPFGWHIGLGGKKHIYFNNVRKHFAFKNHH